MASDQALAWMYAENLVNESEVVLRARANADDYGIASITPAAGQFLRFLVRTCAAKNVVEVGTGAGVSGLYLLDNPEVTLTTIDVEREAQHSARQVFTEAGIRQARIRLIPGRSADLMPRLAAGSYDVVVLDGDPLEAQGDVSEALRLLRSGGLLVVTRALMGGRVADPARREDDVVAMRELVHSLLESDDVEATLVPIGDGMLVAYVL